jgi:hypothetical protein
MRCAAFELRLTASVQGELAPESAPVKVALAGRELAQGRLVEAEHLLASVKDLPPGLSMQGYVQYSLFLMGVGRPAEAVGTRAEPADINGAAIRRLDDPQAALTELRGIFNDPHFSA